MGKNTEKVVGVFMDEAYAQRAMQALQGAGYNARIADESAIKAFKNSGFQDEIINIYQSRYNEGNTILVVDAGNRGEDALGIMLQNGAEYINLSDKSGKGGQQGRYTAQQYAQMNAAERQYGNYNAQTGRASTSEEMRVRLHEEQLTPVKTAQQAGEVEVRKVVHEREQQVPVNLRREEVYVERRAVNEPANPDEIGNSQDEVIRVPVYEEQAQLQKQARVTEEVGIGKRAVENQQTLTGTTRHEHLEVVNSGDVQVQGDVDGNQTKQGTTTRTTTKSESTRRK